MCDRECVAGVIHSCVLDPKQRIQRACYLQSGGFGSRVDRVTSPGLPDVITVADSLDRNENATLEYQASHQFARTKVVDPLGDDNVGNQSPESRVAMPGVTSFRFVEPMAERANGVTDLPCGRRFAADGYHLLLVHAVTDDFAAATKRVRKLARQQGCNGKSGYEQHLREAVGHRIRTVLR